MVLFPAVHNKLLKLKKGQSLIELIAATGIVLLIVTGILVSTNRSVKNTDFSKTQAQATKYAQEGIEIARNERDQNPASFWNRTGTEIEQIENNNIPFTRETMYTPIGTDRSKMSVKVNIKWQDTSGNHQISQESILTNTKQW